MSKISLQGVCQTLYIYVYIHIYIYRSTHPQTHIHVYLYIYIYAFIYLYIHTHIYIYIDSIYMVVRCAFSAPPPQMASPPNPPKYKGVCVCMAQGKTILFHRGGAGGGFSFLPGPHAQLENHKTAGGISCSTGGGRGEYTMTSITY